MVNEDYLFFFATDEKEKIMHVEQERSDVHPCRHVIVAVATSEFLIF